VNDLSLSSTSGRAAVFDDATVGSANWWFAALDQRWFGDGAERWLTQIVGIHEDGGDVWIQLQSIGEQLRDFTIRVCAGMSVADVVGAIERQIRSGAPSDSTSVD